MDMVVVQNPCRPLLDLLTAVLLELHDRRVLLRVLQSESKEIVCDAWLIAVAARSQTRMLVENPGSVRLSSSSGASRSSTIGLPYHNTLHIVHALLGISGCQERPVNRLRLVRKSLPDHLQNTLTLVRVRRECCQQFPSPPQDQSVV